MISAMEHLYRGHGVRVHAGRAPANLVGDDPVPGAMVSCAFRIAPWSGYEQPRQPGPDQSPEFGQGRIGPKDSAGGWGFQPPRRPRPGRPPSPARAGGSPAPVRL